MNVVIDWDGTVTTDDTLSAVLKHFVDPAILNPLNERVDAALEAGTISLRDVMGLEFQTLTAPLAAVVDFVVERATIRPGFAAFAERYDPLIVSTSFRQTIEPVLRRDSISARLVPSEAQPSSDGRIFARAGLATYLDRIGRPYERFTDFNDITKALTQV